jgi:hypothetical protein
LWQLDLLLITKTQKSVIFSILNRLITDYVG